MAEFEVSVLGPLLVSRDGVEVAVGGPRQQAVLARLALAEGAIVAVDRLVDDLWSGDPPRTAVGTVHSYVSRLRTALASSGPPAIERVGEGYRLTVGRDALTAVRFEDAVTAATAPGVDPVAAVAALDVALGLWRGDALAGFADQPWAQPAAVQLEELRLTAEEARFEHLLAAGRHVATVGDLERAVGEHPLRERRAALLVLALYRSGRQADALRAYERTRSHLVEELGLDPGPELTTLADRVLAQDPALAPAEAPATARQVDEATAEPSPAGVPAGQLALPAAARPPGPLVGRGIELDVIARAWTTVTAGARHLLAISGEAGMGKTRLAQAAAGLARTEGGHVFWGRSTIDTLVPYQAILDALTTATRSLGDDVVDALVALHPAVAPLLPARPGARTDVTRWEMYEALAGLVRDVTADRPALLVLDDAQWADASTLSLVRHLLAHHDGRLLVLATVRRPAGRPHPDLDALIADHTRAGTGATAELTGLDDDAVGTLLAHHGVEVDVATAGAVRARTAGNPYFVASLADGDFLDQADPAGGALPESVRQLLDQRLGELGPDAVAVCTAAAVAGPRAGIEVLEAATGLPAGAVLDAVDESIAARILDEDDQLGWVTFPHALVRQALLARATRTRIARTHGLLADALAERGAPAAEVAGHRLAAGDPARGAAAAARAAIAALEALADAEAAEWAARGLEVLPEGAHQERGDLALLLARAERGRGRREAAEAALAIAADAGRRAARPVLVAEAAQELALLEGGVGFSFGDVRTDLLDRIDEALATVPDAESGVRTHLLAWSALARGGAGDPDAVDARSAEALRLAETTDDAHAVALARLARRIARNGPAGLDERLALGPATTEAAAGWTDLGVVSLVLEVADRLEAGRIVEARKAREQLRDLVAPHDRPAYTGYLGFVDACWALAEGDLDEAAALTDHALRVGGDALGANALQAWAGQQYAIARERDDLGPLVPQVQAMVEALPDLPVWRVALAACLVGTGEHDGARAAYAPLLDAAGRLDLGGESPFWYTTAAQLAEVVHVLGDTAVAAQLVDALTPYAVRFAVAGMGAVTLGPVRRALGLARATAGDPVGAADDLAAAAAASAAAGFEPWRARAERERDELLGSA